MNIIRGIDRYTRPAYPVLTIGNFDGMHVGHQALLNTVVRRAEATGGTATVLTFDPHPVTVLKPDIRLQLLSAPDEKLGRIAATGIHEVLFLTFDRAFAGLSPEAFVSTVLIDGIGARELFVGEHFAFGKGRTGTIDDLRRLCARAGTTVMPVPPTHLDGEIVSSTRVRRLLLSGDVHQAARCLGRWYSLSGVVVEGARRGRELGWPTANLRLPEQRVLPPDGVYAGFTCRHDVRYASAAYIGARPTFGAGERLLEIYLLDQTMSLYGESICFEFVERLRDDATFASAQALSAQIETDIRRTKEALATTADLAQR